MTDESNNTPVENETENMADNLSDTPDDAVVAEAEIAPETAVNDEHMNERLERLGGEPAPVITPEEFARLQRAGQVHIDARGRVRTSPRDPQAGVSLRKRRAWYGR